MSRLRALTGPLAIGVSAWCAAGHVTVATADAATLRLAVPAPWWILVVAGLASALIPALRRDPKLALPALLSTLPWWPVPLPAIALMWTGPLAWAPILLSVGAAAGGPLLRALGRLPGAADCARAHRLAGVATLVVAGLAAWSAAPRVPSGDEPHYLVATQSLLADGDLQVENNYKARSHAAYFGGSLTPDFIQRGKNGQIYSIHAPGLSAVVLPAFAIAGYRGAQATVLLLAGIAGALIWRLSWRASKDVGAAWFAWAAVVGSPTFLFQSFSIFPDGPGAMAVAAGALLLLRLGDAPEAVGTRALVVTSALLGALPWLHTRFAALAGALGVLVVWQLLVDPSRPLAARRARVLTFLALPVISAAGWFAFFQVVYGTPNPAAPYGDTSGRDGTRPSHIPGGFVALLLDGQFGLLSYSPVLIVAALGVWRAVDRRMRSLSLALVAVIGLYFSAVASYWMWWAGIPATPARFATAALPLLAPLVAVAWKRAAPNGRRSMLALLAASLAITALVVCLDRAGLAWNDRDGEARWLEWLGPVVNLPRGWPSFFWKLNPDNLVTEIPFAIHASVWLGVLASGGVVMRQLARRMRSGSATSAVVGWGIAASLMGAVQAGWWLNAVNGLDPARSQMALLAASRDASPIVQIGALQWGKAADLAAIMRIRSDEPGLRDANPAPLALSAVSAGTYELRFAMVRPREARVAVRIGRSPQPTRTFELLAVKQQSFTLALPAGAASLSIPSEPALRAAGLTVEMAPIEVSASTPLSQSVSRYASTDVFFLDDAVFPETDGFWVKGGQTAEVVLTGPAVGTIQILLRNGAAANAVVVEAGGFARTLALGPSEERVVDLPASQAGIARLRIASPAGFRPSDSGSGDRRYLGVWIQPR